MVLRDLSPLVGVASGVLRGFCSLSVGFSRGVV